MEIESLASFFIWIFSLDEFDDFLLGSFCELLIVSNGSVCSICRFLKEKFSELRDLFLISSFSIEFIIEVLLSDFLRISVLESFAKYFIKEYYYGI